MIAAWTEDNDKNMVWGMGGGGALELGQQEMWTALALILKTGDRTKNLTKSV